MGVSLPALPPVISKPISRGAEVVRGSIGSWTWGPVLAIAKPAILSVLSRIETGTLLIVDEPAGTRYVYGQKLSGKLESTTEQNGLPRRADTIPRLEIVVKDDAFWMRLFLFADMGFAEAYMLGDFECKDLTSFFQVSSTFTSLRRPFRPTHTLILAVHCKSQSDGQWNHLGFQHVFGNLKCSPINKHALQCAAQHLGALQYQQ